MNFRRTRTSPIGIDIGTHSIKAVQLSTSASGAVITSAAVLPRPPQAGAFSPEEAERLVSALWRQNFRGQKFVLGAPASQLYSTVMELPPRKSGAPLSEIARGEVARSQKIDNKAFELVWWELPGGARASEGTHVMGVSLKHTDAEALLDAFESAGAEVVAIDAPTLATVRALQPRLAPAPELTAVADASWSASEVVIVHGDSVVYQRHIAELGQATLMAALKTTLSVDDETAMLLLSEIGCDAARAEASEFPRADAVRSIVLQHVEALASELSMSLSYAGRRFGSQVARVLVTGGATSVPGFASHMSTQVTTPAVITTAADLVETSDSCMRICRAAPMLTALGLAQHSFTGAQAA